MKSPKPLVLIGTARQESNTRTLVEKIFQGEDIEIIDLQDHQIANYNYAHDYPAGDEFMELYRKMLDHQALVFATPVYWYSMSAAMKIFFDRITDVLDLHPDLRAAMKGKHLFLASVGGSPELPLGFEIPFSMTAEYMEMHYGGGIYSWSRKLEEPLPGREAYVAKVKAAARAQASSRG